MNKSLLSDEADLARVKEILTLAWQTPEAGEIIEIAKRIGVASIYAAYAEVISEQLGMPPEEALDRAGEQCQKMQEAKSYLPDKGEPS